MDILGFLIWIIFGAVIGWIAGVIMKDERGLLGNIIVGIVGSMIGALLSTLVTKTAFGNFSLMGVIFSVLGAMLLIFLKQLLMGKRH